MLSALKHSLLRLLPHSLMLFRIPAPEPVLYLTFDDGPQKEYTEALLDLLALHNVKATFFCIGSMINKNYDIAKRITMESHAICSHSYHHLQFSTLPLAKQMDEIIKTDKLIKETTGLPNLYFRAPQGKWSIPLLWKLWRRGLIPAHWSYDSMDYKKGSSAMIVELFNKKAVKNGDVILFHDDNKFSIEALELLLPKWKSEGFRFAKITDI